MRNIQTTKGGLGVFALAFAASLLLLLPGCQGPLGTERAAPETGTVRLALELPPVGRAILPTITLGDFDHFRLLFATPGGDYVYSTRWSDYTDGTVELSAGLVYLFVTAYLDYTDYNEGDNLLYSGPPIPVNVVAGAVTPVGNITLRPLPLIGAYGLFTWNVTFPAGSTATLTVGNLDNTVVGAPVTITSGSDGYMELAAGRYNVLVRVVDGTDVAILGKPLYVLSYLDMPSHLEHVFEAAGFRPLVTDTLGSFIARTGDGWPAQPPGWIGIDIIEGAFAAGDELHLSGAAATEWVNNDGALALRVTGRTAQYHGVDLRVAGLGLQARDTIIVTGRAIGTAVTPGGDPGRAIAANAALGGWDIIGESGNLGAGALDHAAFTLTANLGEQDTAGVRIHTNSWNLIGAPANDGIHTFYITSIEINRMVPFSAPLSNLVSFGGYYPPSPGWLDTVVTTGPFAAVGPFPAADGGVVTWAEANDNLLLRQTGRTVNYHGINLTLLGAGGLNLQTGDVLYVRGQVYADDPAGATFRRMEINLAGATDHLAEASVGSGVRGWTGFELRWVVGLERAQGAPMAELPTVVRIATNGNGTAPSGLTAFQISEIEVYRPDPDVQILTAYLGEFISLTGGMPTTQAWQNISVTASNAVSTAAGQPLRNADAVTLTWVDVNGSMVLRMTNRTGNWFGLDIVHTYLGFTADGVYQMRVTGTMATGSPELSRNPHDSAGWLVSVRSPLEWDGRAFTLTTTNFRTDDFGAATAIRIQGTVGVDIDITGITFERLGNACPDCDRLEDECICDADGPVFVGARGTVVRPAYDLVHGDAVGMASLLEANHFAAVNQASFGTRDGYVFVYNIVNNSSGLRILPTALAGLEPGDILRATGRTTGAVENSRLELALVGAGAGAGMGNEAVTPGSPWSIPATAFTFDRILTADDIAGGLRIAPNSWSWGADEGWADRFTGVAFSIDDLIIFRPPPPEGVWSRVFRMADYIEHATVTAGTAVPGTGAASSAFSRNTGFAGVSWVADNPVDGVDLSVRVGPRTANWHDARFDLDGLLNVMGIAVQAGDEIFIAGRAVTVAAEVDWGRRVEGRGAGVNFDGSIPAAFTGTHEFSFTAALTASAGHVSVAGNGGGAEPNGITYIYIDNVIINGYRVGGTPIGGASASLNISFDQLRNRIDPIVHTVPLGGVVGSTIAAPSGFSGHSWSRNLAVIGSGSTLTLDASFQRAGRHLVTLRADFNGRMYSQIVEVVVTT